MKVIITPISLSVTGEWDERRKRYFNPHIRERVAAGRLLQYEARRSDDVGVVVPIIWNEASSEEDAPWYWASLSTAPDPTGPEDDSIFALRYYYALDRRARFDQIALSLHLPIPSPTDADIAAAQERSLQPIKVDPPKVGENVKPIRDEGWILHWARTDVKKRFPISSASLVRMDRATWPDWGLGLVEADDRGPSGPVHGVRIEFEAEGFRYVYHGAAREWGPGAHYEVLFFNGEDSTLPVLTESGRYRTRYFCQTGVGWGIERWDAYDPEDVQRRPPPWTLVERGTVWFPYQFVNRGGKFAPKQYGLGAFDQIYLDVIWNLDSADESEGDEDEEWVGLGIDVGEDWEIVLTQPDWTYEQYLEKEYFEDLQRRGWRHIEKWEIIDFMDFIASFVSGG